MTTTGLLDLSHFTTWLASGERGISSEAIVSQLTGQQVGKGYWGGSDHPCDPDDFRRCELLLRACPLARLVFPSLMPSRSPIWAELVEHWDELVALIEEEAPGVFTKWTGGAVSAESVCVDEAITGRGMTDPIGTIRLREEPGTVSCHVKTADNRWVVVYASPEESIEGHVSDAVATRWPVFYRPKYVEGNPE